MRKDHITNKPGTSTVIDFPSQESRIQVGNQTALETLIDAIIYVYLLEKQIKKGATRREEMHNQKRDYGKNLSLKKSRKRSDYKTSSIGARTRKKAGYGRRKVA